MLVTVSAQSLPASNQVVCNILSVEPLDDVLTYLNSGIYMQIVSNRILAIMHIPTVSRVQPCIATT